MALLNDSDSFLTNIERLPGFGGLYILRIYRKSHPLFDIVSSEQIQSEKLTNTIRPPPFLSLSRLALISQPSRLNCAFGKLSSN